MGLMQKAVETYDYHEGLVGVPVAGHPTLVPISHIVQNAQIEITIDKDGNFAAAETVIQGKIPGKDDSKTIIPATEKSANRTAAPAAHPLSDQLTYVLPKGKNYELYVQELTKWADSEFSHPKVQAILQYVRKGTMQEDLVRSGVITCSHGMSDKKYEKAMVRWRVNGCEDSRPCWEDPELFRAFIQYNQSLQKEMSRDLCMISGEEEPVTETHPKGILSSSYGAKLISANDSSGFTYRGRYTEARQAATVGYLTSQKAHNALRWVIASQGVLIGGRAFVCWNPKGKRIPSMGLLSYGWGENQKAETPSDYRDQLRHAMSGWRQELPDHEDVVIASFDAATTGRLSVTYYNELWASDFLDRLKHWQETCCWENHQFGYQSPSIYQIVKCAYGVERNGRLEVDDRLMREQAQRLLHCVVDRERMQMDLVHALRNNASSPLRYESRSRREILFVACAVSYAYRTDVKKEEWSMALEKGKADRSYQFGRLLAAMEQVERQTYDVVEKREPNAIRMQSVFCERPLATARILNERIEPYMERLTPGSRAFYRGVIGEIMEQLSRFDDVKLNRPLEDSYLMGYYLQRNAFYAKKDKTEEGEQ